LITSTILTLIVLPVLYTYFEKLRERKMNKSVPAAIIALLVMFGVPAKAQTLPAGPLTLQQAIGTAISNNQNVRSSQLQIGQQQALKGSSTDLGKTSFNLQYGQINGINRDNNISVQQNIPWLGLFKNQREVYNARISAAEIGLIATKNQLTYEVRQAYTQVTYYVALQKLYQTQDSVYSAFLKAAALRYKTGETNLLEKTTAETQYNEVKNQMIKNLSDIAASKSELGRLLNTKDSLSVNANQFAKTDESVPGLDSGVFKNPLLAYQRQQIVIADKNIGLERSRSGPDFTVGYFNQSIIGSQTINGQDRNFTGANRFQGIQAGISVPLFFKPYASRIKAAKIDKQVTEAQYSLYETNLQSQYQQAYQDLLKNSRSIEYYEKSALPNTNLILKQAQIAFQSGEIGYVEFSQALRTFSEIRFNYLQAINQYNQSVYTLQYLIGL
jgi:cobalt-zinc-cadmium resistance protein CzcA